MAVAALSVATVLAGEPKRHGDTDPWVHDPVMAYEDGTYHLYCTGPGILSMTSCDLHSWDIAQRGVLQDHIPAWAHDSVPGLRGDLWAPDIVRYRDRWYMAYSCSTFGKNTSAIGLLSADRLSDNSGWRDEGCIIASREGRDNWNAIDPNFVIDDNGQPWLTYGSFWDGIQLLRLDTTLHAAAGARPFTIARRYAKGSKTLPANPTSDFAGPNAIEAPFIFKHQGWYYLFVSHDYCCRGMKSNYRVVVGRSRSITGPYLDQSGKPMLEGGGTLVIEGDKKQYEAAGHCAVYHFSLPKKQKSGDLFICHGYSIKSEGTPKLVIRKVRWNHGWPELK